MNQTVIITYAHDIDEHAVLEIIPRVHRIFRKGSPREIWVELPAGEVGMLLNAVNVHTGMHAREAQVLAGRGIARTPIYKGPESVRYGFGMSMKIGYDLHELPSDWISDGLAHSIPGVDEEEETLP